MTTDTPQIRPLAIVAGVASVLTALTILLGPSVFRIAEWTQYHAITVSVVFVTIAFLHLRAEAWRSGHRLAAFGFVFLAIVGTSLIVGQSVGRQAEATGATMMSASDLNDRIAAKASDLASAKARLANAQRMADKEMTGQRCKDRCRAWKDNASDISNAVRQLEADIAALGPQRPVNAKAEKIADLLAVAGIGRSTAIAFWTLIEPFALTLLFEFGSVISFAYAFPHRTVAKPAERSAETMAVASEAELTTLRKRFFTERSAEVIPFPLPDNDPNGSGPKPGKRTNGRKSDVLADIQARIDAGERFASQEELRAALAERFGHISRSTLSEWLAELAVSRNQDGRRKRVG